MPRKPPLRAVAPDETAEPKAPRSVTQAVDTGSEREVLLALLRVAAAKVDAPNTPAAAVAALLRRVQEIHKDLAALDAREAEDAEGAGVATPDEAWEVG